MNKTGVNPRRSVTDRLHLLQINVKNFHGSLTTVVRAQNDTSKTANITFSILHVERYTRPYQRSHAKMESKILKPC